MIATCFVSADVRCWDSGSPVAFMRLGLSNAVCESSTRPCFTNPAARSTANSAWRNFRVSFRPIPLSMNLMKRRDIFLPSVAALALIVNFASLQSLPAFSQSQRVESTVVGHGAGAQTKVGKNRLWSELNDSERKAASFLGFDAESWDTDNKVYIDRLTWDELSPAQRKAAKTLSFNKKTWNDEGKLVHSVVVGRMHRVSDPFHLSDSRGSKAPSKILVGRSFRGHLRA